MKTLKSILLPISFLSLAACGGMHAANNSTSTSVFSTTSTTTTDGSSTGLSVIPSSYNSDTVALTSSTAQLDQLFFLSKPQNPMDLRVQVDLADSGNGTYGGSIIVAYEENGVTHHLKVSSTHPYANISDTSLNVWRDWQGKGSNQFHGIFEDASSAIVLVIDDVLALGDGSGSAIVGGSIWFQNFSQTFPVQGPQLMCWAIQVGPYDCRTFITGSTDYRSAKVNTTSSLYPTTSTTGGDGISSSGSRPGYTKLGSFSGLSKTAAFGQ